MMSITVKLLGVLSLLVIPARSHLSHVCTSTDPASPGIAYFYMITYHTTPRAGSSVPGNFHIISPAAKHYSFAFTSFKQAAAPELNTKYVPMYKLRKNMRATFNGLNGNPNVTDNSIIDCYVSSRVYKTVHGSRAVVGKAIANTTDSSCAINEANNRRTNTQLKTYYYAKLTNITSGDYLAWTTGTDMNLDAFGARGSSNTYGVCGMGPLNASLPLSIAQSGASCAANSFPTLNGIDAATITGCKAKVSSGFNCGFSCATNYTKSNYMVCQGGSWTGNGYCAAVPGTTARTIRTAPAPSSPSTSPSTSPANAPTKPTKEEEAFLPLKAVLTMIVFVAFWVAFLMCYKIVEDGFCNQYSDTLKGWLCCCCCCLACCCWSKSSSSEDEESELSYSCGQEKDDVERANDCHIQLGAVKPNQE